MPWIDLAGNAIADTPPFPSATDTDAGIEVRLGERRWLLTEEVLGGRPMPKALVRSDCGLVMLFEETAHTFLPAVKSLNCCPTARRALHRRLGARDAARRLGDRHIRRPIGPAHPSNLIFTARPEPFGTPRSGRAEPTDTIRSCL